jgi:hypothetical protein
VLIKIPLAYRTTPAGAPESRRAFALVIPIGALPRYDRPAPSLSSYNDLLTRSRT